MARAHDADVGCGEQLACRDVGGGIDGAAKHQALFFRRSRSITHLIQRLPGPLRFMHQAGQPAQPAPGKKPNPPPHRPGPA